MRTIVIGAGLVGLATAWRLVTCGHEVTVLDPAPASGATHAAGGMLTPVGEVEFGEDALSALLFASARRYPDFIAQVAAHLPEGTPTGLLEHGTLIVGADIADRSTLQDHHRLALDHGLTSEALTARDARRREPLLGPRLSCAFSAPDDHAVDPRVLAQALLAALTQRGDAARLVPERARAVRAGAAPTVELDSGERLEADVVVVANALGAADLEITGTDGAAGVGPSPTAETVRSTYCLDGPGGPDGVAGVGPSPITETVRSTYCLGGSDGPGGLDEPDETGGGTIRSTAGPDLGRLLRPVHGEVLRLHAPAHLAPLLTGTIRGLVAGRPVYVIPRGDGRVLLGATSREDATTGVLAGGLHTLLDDAIRLMPAIREFTVEEVLARARPGTPDNAPLVGPAGPAAPGVILATGTFRHGILLAPIVADLVAAHVRALAGTPDPGDADLLHLGALADPARFTPQESA